MIFLVKSKLFRLKNRIPPRLRKFGWPLLGGMIGLFGGVPGFFIGILLAYLLGELLTQVFLDRKIQRYYENPGKKEFNEGESGLAAWCGLAVLLASESFPGSKEDAIKKQVTLAGSIVFPQADPRLFEHFSRLALSRLRFLSPDLLAESLAAGIFLTGESSAADAKIIGLGLINLARGEKALILAKEILAVLGIAPDGDGGYGGIGGAACNLAADGREPARDPWKILGLSPGASMAEVKAHYRRLAKQFHPDEYAVLDEVHRESAARAFIAIQEAYKEIVNS